MIASHREDGIQYRKDESIGGWFSQIGEMHQVHHLWGEFINIENLSPYVESMFNTLAYKDLVDRHETRQAAWSHPGWDKCVMRTGECSLYAHTHTHMYTYTYTHTHTPVPLIRYMVVRVLVPTDFSPLQ